MKIQILLIASLFLFPASAGPIERGPEHCVLPEWMTVIGYEVWDADAAFLCLTTDLDIGSKLVDAPNGAQTIVGYVGVVTIAIPPIVNSRPLVSLGTTSPCDPWDRQGISCTVLGNPQPVQYANPSTVQPVLCEADQTISFIPFNENPGLEFNYTVPTVALC